MTKKQWCSSHNHDVTIADCVRCRLLCVHNPSAHESGLWSGYLVQRWGSAEINGFLDGRRAAADGS